MKLGEALRKAVAEPCKLGRHRDEVSVSDFVTTLLHSHTNKMSAYSETWKYLPKQANNKTSLRSAHCERSLKFFQL
jgi:hypothetical protein